MDIKDAKILWDRTGQVKVIPMSRDETPAERRLSASYGACDSEWADASDERRQALMLAQFARIVTVYGVDPQVAHEAFLEIDQYRQAVAPETIPDHDD